MFYIIEIQKTDDEHCAHIVQTATTQNEAESKYHLVLASAAISNVPLHSCVLITDTGFEISHQFYEHEPTPEPEPEEE